MIITDVSLNKMVLNPEQICNFYKFVNKLFSGCCEYLFEKIILKHNFICQYFYEGLLLPIIIYNRIKYV